MKILEIFTLKSLLQFDASIARIINELRTREMTKTKESLNCIKELKQRICYVGHWSSASDNWSLELIETSINLRRCKIKHNIFNVKFSHFLFFFFSFLWNNINVEWFDDGNSKKVKTLWKLFSFPPRFTVHSYRHRYRQCLGFALASTSTIQPLLIVPRFVLLGTFIFKPVSNKE